MFDNLSDRLTQTLRGINNRNRLSEANVSSIVTDVRKALIEADVAISVARDFTENIKEKAIGQIVTLGLNPGQEFVKIVHDELVAVMGNENHILNLSAQPPAVVLMAGLQGSGKTTTAAKLAHRLRSKERKKVALVSADIYRPAAIEQLELLAEGCGAHFIHSSSDQEPQQIALNALQEAQQGFFDVLIVDTAGRTAIDDLLMEEIKSLKGVLAPTETLFVVDCMTGQDAANTAKIFDRELGLTGVVLSKADGDARGGAALSVRSITGKPIKFLGIGEKIDELEPFYPDRLASRILGMGDVLSLIEQAEEKIDKRKAQQLARKVQKGKKFNLEDFRSQIEQMSNMGGVESMLEKIPGASSMPAKAKIEGDLFVKMGVIIDSMTIRERRYPDLINGSRKQRIAHGSGTTVPDVNRLLKQHRQMQKMMKKLGKKGGLQGMMRGMQGGGGLASRPNRR
tara:strand:- start:41 stop:1405 length:1365 start_codon:yes stop_codon:yes gene_type:complete